MHYSLGRRSPYFKSIETTQPSFFVSGFSPLVVQSLRYRPLSKRNNFSRKGGANNCVKTRQNFSPFRKMESINLIKDAFTDCFCHDTSFIIIMLYNYVCNVYFVEIFICKNVLGCMFVCIVY